MPARPSAALRRPLTALRRRVRGWWLARLPRRETLQLTQRNVYILPTRAGLMFALTLVTLLIASINYQLSLGYLLTFLLAGSGLVSMHLTHANLRGLTLRLKPPPPVFAGEPAGIELVLTSATGERHGIGLRLEDAPDDTLAWVDVPAGGQSSAHVSFVPEARGRQPVPLLHAETRFPLGLFRAWTLWRPATDLLVYPRPEHPVPPLPAPAATPTGPTQALARGGGEADGVRPYRRGDPQNLLVWKKAAQAMSTGGELVSRDTVGAARRELQLDWARAAGIGGAEARLSRLAAWVLAAERAGADWTLHLPGLTLPSGSGEFHRRASLEALALWQGA